MLSSGLNYVDTMWFLKDIMGVAAYTEMIDHILNTIKSGGTIYSVLVQYPLLIPTNLAVLFKVWEQTGNITQAIDNGITMYQQDLNKNLDNLSKIIEPVLIIFVWGLLLWSQYQFLVSLVQSWIVSRHFKKGVWSVFTFCIVYFLCPVLLLIHNPHDLR